LSRLESDLTTYIFRNCSGDHKTCFAL